MDRKGATMGRDGVHGAGGSAGSGGAPVESFAMRTVVSVLSASLGKLTCAPSSPDAVPPAAPMVATPGLAGGSSPPPPQPASEATRPATTTARIQLVVMAAPRIQATIGPPDVPCTDAALETR
jgi:hypothetical protein